MKMWIWEMVTATNAQKKVSSLHSLANTGLYNTLVKNIFNSGKG